MEFFPVIRKAGSETTKRVRRPDNDGIANLFRRSKSFVDGIDSDRFGNGDLDFCTKITRVSSASQIVEFRH